jgi:hypothetical protein
MAEPAAPSSKTPWHVWLVGVVSLLWNLVGATDFTMTLTRNKAYMSAFTPAQLDYYFHLPVWVVVVWGIAVWGGALGSILILLRRRQARNFLAVSVVGMVLTDINSFALSDGFKVMGGAPAVVFAAVILVIGILLLLYARSMGKRGVLR